MLAFIFFALTFVLGYAVVSRLPVKLLRVERAAWSAALGMLGLSWLLALPSFALPYVISLPLGVLAAVAATVWLLRRPVPAGGGRLRSNISRHGRTAWVMVSLAITAVFLYLNWLNTLATGPDGWYSGWAAYGDIALHSTLVSWFNAQSHLILKLPVLLDTRLSYPWLFDFYSAVLNRFGWPLPASLAVPSSVLAVAAVQLVMGLGWRLFRRVTPAAIATTLFFAGGPTYNVVVAVRDWLGSGQGLWTWLSALPRSYAYLKDYRVEVMNPLLQLVPQRTSILGLVLFVIVVVLVLEARRAHAASDRPAKGRLLVVAGVIVGLLPFAHIHTFILAGGVLGWAMILACAKARRPDWLWIRPVILALALAAPQLLWQLILSPHVQLGGLTLGWRFAGENHLAAWIIAFGLIGPLFIAMPFLLRHYRVPGAWLFVPAAIVFVACNVYIFQPWGFDNMKLLTYAYLLVCLPLGYVLFRYVGRSKVRFALAGAFVAVMVTSGLLAFAREAQNPALEFSTADQALGRWTAANTPATAVFAIATRHNHPVPALGGREVLIGYTGWLWSYGLDYTAREADNTAILAATDPVATRALLDRYGITYVAAGPGEAVNTARYGLNYPTVYSQDSYTVYRITR